MYNTYYFLLLTVYNIVPLRATQLQVHDGFEVIILDRKNYGLCPLGYV